MTKREELIETMKNSGYEWAKEAAIIWEKDIKCVYWLDTMAKSFEAYVAEINREHEVTPSSNGRTVDCKIERLQVRPLDGEKI